MSVTGHFPIWEMDVPMYLVGLNLDLWTIAAILTRCPSSYTVPTQFQKWNPNLSLCLEIFCDHLKCNNNNNNKHDNVYGAVIIAEPLQEFTRFIWWM